MFPDRGHRIPPEDISQFPVTGRTASLFSLAQIPKNP